MKLFIVKVLAVFLVIGASVASCSKSKTEVPNPLVCPADSLLSYAQHVEPILADQCGGCHYASFGPVSGNVNLEGYDNAKTQTKLDCAISWSGECTPMPEAGKMDDSLVTIVRCWIQNGYKP